MMGGTRFAVVIAMAELVGSAACGRADEPSSTDPIATTSPDTPGYGMGEGRSA